MASSIIMTPVEDRDQAAAGSSTAPRNVQAPAELPAEGIQAVVPEDPPAGEPGSRWRSLRQVVPSVAASVLVTFLQAAQGIVLFRLLGEQDRGIHSTVINYTQTFLYISMFGTFISLTQLAGRQREQLSHWRLLGLKSGVLTGLVGGLLVGTAVWLFLPLDKRPWLVWCLVCTLALPAEHIRNNLLSVEQGAGNLRYFNWLRMFAAGMFPLLLLFAWLLGLHQPEVTACLWIVAFYLGLLPFLRRDLWRPVANRVPPHTAPSLLSQSKGFAASVLATDLFNRMDGFLAAQWFAAFASVGSYAAACPIAQLMLVVPNTFGVFSFNHGSTRQGPTNRRQILGYALLVLAFQVASGLAFAALIGWLIPTLYGPESKGVTPFVLRLLPGFTLAGVGTVAECYLRGCGDVLPGIYGRCGGWLAIIVLGYLGVRWYGPTGLALAASAVQGLVAVWVCTCMYRNIVRHDLAVSLISKEAAAC